MGTDVVGPDSPRDYSKLDTDVVGPMLSPIRTAPSRISKQGASVIGYLQIPGLPVAKCRILKDPGSGISQLVWAYEPHQYINIKRNNQTTSTKCQYHAAASKPK